MWYYLWLYDGDCPEKTEDRQEALRWAKETRAETGKDAWVEDEDHNIIEED